jgi:ADP-ribose pyrophosphatase
VVFIPFLIQSATTNGTRLIDILGDVKGPEIILQKQYRPPVEKVVIEVPAGLIDAGESAEEAAIRELKEETGFVGVVSESSTIMFNGISLPSLSQPCDTF